MMGVTHVLNTAEGVGVRYQDSTWSVVNSVNDIYKSTLLDTGAGEEQSKLIMKEVKLIGWSFTIV